MYGLKYLYYSHKQKKLIALYLENGEFDLWFVEFPFRFETKICSDYTELVRYCNSYNKQTVKEYKALYGINPPYSLHTFLNINGAVMCSFVFHKKSITAGDGLNFPMPSSQIWNQHTDAPLFKFCKEHQDDMFELGALKNFHRFFCEQAVFVPCGSTKFKVRAFGQTFLGEVTGSDDFKFLSIPKLESNTFVFLFYRMSHDKILRVINRKLWQGEWPETDINNFYRLIDYINKRYYANFIYNKFEINDKSVVSSLGRFDFKQNKKSGKWFLTGGLKAILDLLEIESIEALKERMNEILGNKKRNGVFPECDSKEELMMLIKTIRNGSR